MSLDRQPDPDEKDLVNRVSTAVPDGWGAVIVLAKRDDTGLLVLSGGKGLDKETSITLLREVLRALEKPL